MSEVGRSAERRKAVIIVFSLRLSARPPLIGGFVFRGDVVRCGGERVPALGHEG